MPLIETQILQGPVALLEWVDSVGLELAILGFIRHPKWSPIIIERKLAILGLQESE